MSEFFEFVKICHGFVREFSNLVVTVYFFSKAKAVPPLLTKVVIVLFSLTLKVHVYVHITSNP